MIIENPHVSNKSKLKKKTKKRKKQKQKLDRCILMYLEMKLKKFKSEDTAPKM